MMKDLKADFHSHTCDDPVDHIGHSAEMLIDAAAAKNLQVFAITCHDAVVYNAYLVEYARRRGILLIPGLERTIEGKHVLILNPDDEQASVSSFEELKRLGRRDAAVIAPHPFFPTGTALGGLLEENIDLFDAIEYSHFYVRGLNFNRRALRLARRAGLPMVGTTDLHALPYEDTTFTWVSADPTIESVIEAIRNGKVRVETRPRAFREVMREIMGLVKHEMQKTAERAKPRYFKSAKYPKTGVAE